MKFKEEKKVCRICKALSQSLLFHGDSIPITPDDI